MTPPLVEAVGFIGHGDVIAVFRYFAVSFGCVVHDGPGKVSEKEIR